MALPDQAAVLGVAVVFATGVLGGAARQVPVRPTPTPGQVIRVTTEQEILLRTGREPEQSGPPQLHTKGILAFSQKNGRFDAAERLEAQVTIERLDLDDSVGGQPKIVDTAPAKGRVIPVVFDRSGTLVSIKIPPDMREVGGRLAQLLAGAYGPNNFLPAVSLGVGEETTVSSELPMRLPGTAAAGPLQARVNLRLRAIDSTGADRIASLEQRIDALTPGALTITGGGRIDVNVDKGFVSGIDTEWKIVGSLPASKSAAQPSPFVGSIKIRLSAN